MKGFRTLKIAIVLLGLGGCAAHVSGLYHDESFTRDSIVAGRMAIGGVVSALRPLSDAERSRYAESLLRELRDERPDYPFVPAGEIAVHADRSWHLSALDRYRTTGAVHRDDLGALRELLPSVRYVAFARVERNDVARRQSHSEENVADSAEDEEEGEYEQIRVTLRREATRTVSASLAVYDLERRGRVVWSGSVTESKRRSNAQSRVFDKEKRWKQELVTSAVAGLLHLDVPYPAPAPTGAVLAEVFEGFAENMPEAD